VNCGKRGAIVLGILMIMLGLLAIAKPLFATLAAELLFGWVLISVALSSLSTHSKPARRGKLL
jgi:uncharacterized membrane protein HdeD (DUF308 family)